MDLGGLWICPARSYALTGSISRDGSLSAGHEWRGHFASDGHRWLRHRPLIAHRAPARCRANLPRAMAPNLVHFLELGAFSRSRWANMVVIDGTIDQTGSRRDWDSNDYHGCDADVSNAPNREASG